AAAKTVRMEYFNPQGQQRYVFPPSFALARAYLDQLERSEGLTAETIATARSELASAEAASPAERREVLTARAARLESAVDDSPDAAKGQLLVEAVRDLVDATPAKERLEGIGEGQ